jgi:hypothetical protein
MKILANLASKAFSATGTALKTITDLGALLIKTGGQVAVAGFAFAGTVVIGGTEIAVQGLKTIDDITVETIKAIRDGSKNVDDSKVREIEAKFAKENDIPIAAARLALKRYVKHMNDSLGDKGHLTYKESLLLKDALDAKGKQAAEGLRFIDREQQYHTSSQGQVQDYIELKQNQIIGSNATPYRADKDHAGIQDHLFWQAVQEQTGVTEEQYYMSLSGDVDQGVWDSVSGTHHPITKQEVLASWDWDRIEVSYTKKVAESNKPAKASVHVDKPNMHVHQNEDVHVAVA